MQDADTTSASSYRKSLNNSARRKEPTPKSMFEAEKEVRHFLDALKRNISQSLGEVIVLEKADGSKYEGTIIDGVKEGYGKKTWPTGQVYEGEFLKGRRHGHGCFTF